MLHENIITSRMKAVASKSMMILIVFIWPYVNMQCGFLKLLECGALHLDCLSCIKLNHIVWFHRKSYVGCLGYLENIRPLLL